MNQRLLHEKDPGRNPKNEKKISFEIKQKLNRQTNLSTGDSQTAAH